MKRWHSDKQSSLLGQANMRRQLSCGAPFLLLIAAVVLGHGCSQPVSYKGSVQIGQLHGRAATSESLLEFTRELARNGFAQEVAKRSGIVDPQLAARLSLNVNSMTTKDLSSGKVSARKSVDCILRGEPDEAKANRILDSCVQILAERASQKPDSLESR